MTHDEYVRRRDEILSKFAIDGNPISADNNEVLFGARGVAIQAIDQLVLDSQNEAISDELYELLKDKWRDDPDLIVHPFPFNRNMAQGPYLEAQRQIVRGDE